MSWYSVTVKQTCRLPLKIGVDEVESDFCVRLMRFHVSNENDQSTCKVEQPPELELSRSEVLVPNRMSQMDSLWNSFTWVQL